MARSRQRAINFIIGALRKKKAQTAAWDIRRADGKMVDADLYHMSPLQ